MGLSKIKLGDYLERIYCKNSNNKYDEKDVRGVNNNKMLIKTRANINERDFSKFSIVKPGYFFFNHRTSRNGSKFSITYNYTNKHIIVTEDYVIFKIKNEDKLLKEWLYMFFNRPELDRYVITNSWGSSTEFYNWEDLCDIEIELPDLQTQEKYVNVYLSMLENQKNYERGLDDLKLVCDGYIEDLRKKIPCEKIGKYLKIRRDKNVDNRIKNVYGVSNSLKFITASSSVDTSNLSDYKVVNFEDIAYVPTTHMKIWAVAISTIKEPFVVSPIYEVFSVKDKEKLLPEYLFLWLCNDGIIKYAFYNSWGSARENFVFDDLGTISIPIPSLDIQKSIVEIFNALNLRKQINERLKEQIKNICPILIKGSIEEAKKV